MRENTRKRLGYVNIDRSLLKQTNPRRLMRDFFKGKKLIDVETTTYNRIIFYIMKYLLLQIAHQTHFPRKRLFSNWIYACILLVQLPKLQRCVCLRTWKWFSILSDRTIAIPQCFLMMITQCTTKKYILKMFEILQENVCHVIGKGKSWSQSS